jgi:hypothetical protein
MKEGQAVTIYPLGNCYCEVLPHPDDTNTTCDYCRYNNATGTFTKLNPHNADGDFYGVVLDGSKHTVYFWLNELELADHGIGYCAKCGSPDCYNTGKCVPKPSPQETWRKLYRKMRFSHIELVPSIGENEIGLSMSGETYCYPANRDGMLEAIGDVERAFFHAKDGRNLVVQPKEKRQQQARS